MTTTAPSAVLGLGVAGGLVLVEHVVQGLSRLAKRASRATSRGELSHGGKGELSHTWPSRAVSVSISCSAHQGQHPHAGWCQPAVASRQLRGLRMFTARYIEEEREEEREGEREEQKEGEREEEREEEIRREKKGEEGRETEREGRACLACL